MDTVTIISLILFACIIAPSFLLKLPSAKKRYQKMNDRKLIEANVTARMANKHIIIAAILIPLSFGLVIYFMGNIKASYYLTLFIFIALVALISGGIAMQEITRITRSEIEYRKFKKEKVEVNTT